MSNRFLTRMLIVLLLAAAGEGFASEKYAIVVGIDDYSSSGLASLVNAENDARRVASHFRSQDYRVTEILGSNNNAYKNQLDAVVRKIASQLASDDTVVLFFAGHGLTEVRNDIKLGYFVMLPDQPGSRDHLVSSGDMLRYADQLGLARHQLFIFDFCYSGLLGRLPTRAAIPVDAVAGNELGDVFFSRKARQYLSAGGDDQQVLDTGPEGMSWFTYFLLKGLEPGVVNSRDNGLIIFTELAAYVKVNSANRYHTPSDGSMLGHEGGDFLFYHTGHSRPQPDPLPDFDRQTLQALGFITRGETEKIIHTVRDMQKPIDLLYQSWQSLDVNRYLEQLDPEVVQTFLKKSGQRVARGYDEIARKRRAQFPKLSKVDVINYEVMYQGGTEQEATFGVRYSMDFFFADRRAPVQEHNKKECYKVRFNPDAGRWQIIRNDDYLKSICSYD